MGPAPAAGPAREGVTKVRSPAAAGTFYPSDSEELAAAIDGLLGEAKPAEDVRDPVALIVPHAGYVYSGPVAAKGFATLKGSEMRRVVLLGPSHFVPLAGTAVPSAEAWRSPLGDVSIDEELRQSAVMCGAAVDDEPHAIEHTLEVQLPFLQRLFPQLRVLPVAVGISEPEEVADLIDAVGAATPGLLVVVSTDLSHYHDAGKARKLDRRTAEAIVRRDTRAIGPEAACGLYALRGAVEWARRQDLQVRLLDLRNSADTSGDARRVVGYAALAVCS